MQAQFRVPHEAGEEHSAELQQVPEAAIGDEPLAVVQGEDFTTEDLDREYEEVARCFRWSVRRTFRETRSGRSGNGSVVRLWACDLRCHSASFRDGPCPPFPRTLCREELPTSGERAVHIPRPPQRVAPLAASERHSSLRRGSFNSLTITPTRIRAAPRKKIGRA